MVEVIIIIITTFENVTAKDLGHLRAAAVVLLPSLGSEAGNVFLFIFSVADRHQTQGRSHLPRYAARQRPGHHH